MKWPSKYIRFNRTINFLVIRRLSDNTIVSNDHFLQFYNSNEIQKHVVEYMYAVIVFALVLLSPMPFVSPFGHIVQDVAAQFWPI